MAQYFIADDLSGALDAAAAFHHAGRRVVIALSPVDWPEVGGDGVLGLTTETRNADTATARELVRATLARATARGATLRYKKIDSTLRGQLAAELAAILEALPGTRVLLAPANPAVGRTTRDGVLYVNGVPVHETPFGRDPKSPLHTSRIADRLGDLPTRHDIVIPDIEAAADFTRAVAAMDAAGNPWLAVGSGGLVHAIAGCFDVGRGLRTPPIGGINAPSQSNRPPPPRAFPHQRHNGPAKPFPAGFGDPALHPILLLAGSAHPLNRTQIDALVAARPVDRLLLYPSVREEGGASARLRGDRSLVLQLPAARVDPTQALAALITAAVEHLQRTGARHIFAAGGETAFALCARLAIRSLEYLAEIEPGLALARASTPTGPLYLAVKPGGFGDEQTWIRAFDALTHAANPANAPE